MHFSFDTNLQNRIRFVFFPGDREVEEKTVVLFGNDGCKGAADGKRNGGEKSLDGKKK